MIKSTFIYVPFKGGLDSVYTDRFYSHGETPSFRYSHTPQDRMNSCFSCQLFFRWLHLSWGQGFTHTLPFLSPLCFHTTTLSFHHFRCSALQMWHSAQLSNVHLTSCKMITALISMKLAHLQLHRAISKRFSLVWTTFRFTDCVSKDCDVENVDLEFTEPETNSSFPCFSHRMCMAEVRSNMLLKSIDAVVLGTNSPAVLLDGWMDSRTNDMDGWINEWMMDSRENKMDG